MDCEKLEKRLLEIGYANLFLSDNQQLDDVWSGGYNQGKLEQIIKSGNGSLGAKFLANEVLEYFDIHIEENYADTLAQAYVFALGETGVEKGDNLHLSGNLWGLLYEDSDPGYLGAKIIGFGDFAIPYLLELLDDDDRVLYEGGEEATLGNAYQYRIKDFAAFYISRIKNIPIQFYQNITKRDQEILRFKKLINAE